MGSHLNSTNSTEILEKSKATNEKTDPNIMPLSIGHEIGPSSKIPNIFPLNYCMECKMRFISLDEFENHSQGKHPKFFFCLVEGCDSEGYTQLATLYHHEMEKHGKQHNYIRIQNRLGLLHACVKCDLAFRTKRALHDHRKWLHREEKSHVCSKCGKAFETKRYMNKHEASVHCEKAKFPCTYCKKTFKRSDSVSLHQKKCKVYKESRRNSNGGQDDIYACARCGKRFAENRKRHFLAHLYYHREHYACPVCGAGFLIMRSGGSRLVEHVKVHHPEEYHCVDFEQVFKNTGKIVDKFKTKDDDKHDGKAMDGGDENGKAIDLEAIDDNDTKSLTQNLVDLANVNEEIMALFSELTEEEMQMIIK